MAQIAQAHFELGQAEAAANAIVRRATQLWKDVSACCFVALTCLNTDLSAFLETRIGRRHHVRDYLFGPQADPEEHLYEAIAQAC